MRVAVGSVLVAALFASTCLVVVLGT